MNAGEKIKSARLKRNLTQEEVAQKLGVKSAIISSWERGFRSPKFDTLQKLSEAIGCDIFELCDFYSGWNLSSTIPPLHPVTDSNGEEPLEYEASEPLLVYTENGRIVANVRYVKSDLFVGWDDWSGGLFNTEVTHWMPQPRSPKEQKHG